MSAEQSINLAEVKRIFNCDAVRIPWALDHAVSSTGRIFTCRPCKWRRGEPLREMKLGVQQHGYKYIRVYIEPKKCVSITLHKLVAELFIGPCPPGKDRVLHNDGNPANNNVVNLRWGTQKENMADMIRHGRSLKGLRNPNAKLTPGLVTAIKILVTEGYSDAALGAFLGVSSETIRRASNGEHWS